MAGWEGAGVMVKVRESVRCNASNFTLGCSGCGTREEPFTYVDTPDKVWRLCVACVGNRSRCMCCGEPVPIAMLEHRGSAGWLCPPCVAAPEMTG